MQLFDHVPHIDFMGHRKAALAFSVVLVVLSIGSFIFRGLNYSVEFTGGVIVEASYDQARDLADIRSELEKANLGKVQIQLLGAATDVLIRLPPPASGTDIGALRDHVVEVLRSSGIGVQINRFETIGPQVGNDMAQNSGLALFFSSLGIFIYVAVRFRWKLAAGAIVAELHDVITTVGLFSIVGWEFDLSVLGAVLAVLGHSLNDKIVLYDRIRENFRLVRRGTSGAIINNSVNQVLSRTFVTSGATMIAVVALALFGGEALWGFSMALIFGIGIGIYSSIYVASSLALMLNVTPADLAPPKRREAEDVLP
jgi:preprotein translocase subunit SecF